MTKKQMRQTIIDEYLFYRSLYNYNKYTTHNDERAKKNFDACMVIESLFKELFNESLYDIYLESNEYNAFISGSSKF